MKFFGKIIPAWQSILLALLAAGLLILAFPDFEIWFLAWVALVPLMWAVERETSLQKPARSKGIHRAVDSPGTRSFVLGWIFGTIFFFGTCWWLAYAPIHYAAVPWPVAYFLIFIACLAAGIFPGIFAAVLSLLLRRFGSWAFLAAPFVWVLSEFLRYWVTGNNWNAIGYSQALTSDSFGSLWPLSTVLLSSLGGIWVSSGYLAAINGLLVFQLSLHFSRTRVVERCRWIIVFGLATLAFLSVLIPIILIILHARGALASTPVSRVQSSVIALQPNVPMSGMDYIKADQFRNRHISLAEIEIKKLTTANRQPTTVILPESPMNFMYHEDREFQQFIGDFARRNNVSVLFNSAEPDATNGKYFNSAVMVGPDGREAVQYDKIYLLPFGEAVPPFLDGIVPGFVGNFSYGGEYDLFPLGDAKAGVMICFESHFGQLSREYVRNGADVIIEMTNDGYLGPTPVLRQHLANAVFRAVETNRPVLRVTNVGITAYIDERGTVHDPPPSYTEATRVWTVSKSDGSQTFYVKYGDWFAWLCTIVTLVMLAIGFAVRSPNGDKH